jgi:hypothetical protein
MHAQAEGTAHAHFPEVSPNYVAVGNRWAIAELFFLNPSFSLISAWWKCGFEQ